MKEYDLEHALFEDPLCLGICWELKKGSGEYEYQNDNDLGLDRENYEGCVAPCEKVFIGDQGHYMLIDRGFEDPTTMAKNAPDLATVQALLKECNPNLFQLSAAEKEATEAYWKQF